MSLSACSELDVVAEVNDQKVYISDYNNQMFLVKTSYKINNVEFPAGEEYEKIQGNILQDIVQDIVLVDLAKGKGLLIDESKSEEQANDIINRIKEVYENSYTKSLEENNIIEEEFENYIIGLTGTKLYISNLYDEITKDVSVSQEEIQTYYSENSVYYSNSTVSVVDYIFDNKGKADKSYNQVKNSNNTFQEIKDISQGWKDLSDAKELDKLYYGDMPLEFSQIAFNTPVGGISEAIEIDGTYHLIYTYEKEMEDPLPLSDIIETVEKDLLKNKRQELYNKYLENEKIKYNIALFPKRIK